ncbi:MAG: signal peptidase I [Candidatus Colwellbacteria bacterium]|nr:signal peptidase I [Candidatus Colwellbacteria bacterium]
MLPGKTQMRQSTLRFLELFEVLLVAVVAVFVVAFIAQPFRVQGASMTPNFLSGDYVLVDKVSDHFRPLHRGEVVVFKNPENESEYFIKRIVGLPGEQLIISGGEVYIDGKLLKEDYLPPNTSSIGETELTLEGDEYFMMGDNRLQSRDSRSWGSLDGEEIVGLVRLRFWPPNELSVFAY